MASRTEEKERRRQEREAQQQAAQQAAARRRAVQIAGAVVGVAIVAVVIVLLLTGGSKNDTSKADAGRLTADARAAGCTYRQFPSEGREHTSSKVKYKTNPPTSGPHTPTWYQDGVYDPGNAPNLGMQVHTLEHGRIDVQYKPGTPRKTIAQLEALLAQESDGYHMLLYQNVTNMKAQVAATAWTHSLTCPQMNDKVFDAIRTFRARYIDKGPEKIP
jgi:hypothetical protein